MSSPNPSGMSPGTAHCSARELLSVEPWASLDLSEQPLSGVHLGELLRTVLEYVVCHAAFLC